MKFPIVDQVISLVKKPGGVRPRRDRDERLRAGFDVAPVGLAFATIDGHWLNVNERFRTIVGYTREELARISLDSLTHAEDAKKESSMMRKLLAGDTDSYRLEKRVMDKRGKYRLLTVTVTCVRADNGEPEFLVFVVEDTQPGQREAPRESHDRGMAWIVDQLPDICIIRSDDRGLITGWNTGAEKLFGYRRDEVIGKNRRILYRDADGWEGKPTSQLNTVADSGRLEFEDWRVQRDGSHVWVKCAITPFRPEGTVKGYVEVITMPTGVTGTLDVSHINDAKHVEEKKAAELRQIIEALQGEVDLGRRKEESLRDALEQVRVMGEETMNELKIMTGALRKELDRRKAAEDELRLANERLEAASQPPVAAPEPPEPVIEQEIVPEALPPARMWRSLDGMPPAEVLIAHATEHHSGTLILTSGDREKQLFFEKGKVFSVASNNPTKFLTQQLIELGYITEEQRQRALEIKQETHLALGRILLILGAITEEQLIEVMRTKMEDEIADVFDWKDARYAFVEGEVPSLQLVPLRIEVAPLVVKRLNRTADSRQQTADEPPPAPHLAIVASPKSKKFHKETCNSVKRMPAEGRALFASADEAREAGFEACRLCFR
jgi:PAS domain S-box-containing protein